MRNIASQIAKRKTAAATKCHSTHPTRRVLIMPSSTPWRGARSILELHARPDADRPRTPGHDHGSRTAGAGGLTAEVIALVEHVCHKCFDVPLGPIEPGKQIDERR